MKNDLLNCFRKLSMRSKLLWVVLFVQAMGELILSGKGYDTIAMVVGVVCLATTAIMCICWMDITVMIDVSSSVFFLMAEVLGIYLDSKGTPPDAVGIVGIFLGATGIILMMVALVKREYF